jgi:hypothetical protein
MKEPKEKRNIFNGDNNINSLAKLMINERMKVGQWTAL